MDKSNITLQQLGLAPAGSESSDRDQECPVPTPRMARGTTEPKGEVSANGKVDLAAEAHGFVDSDSTPEALGDEGLAAAEPPNMVTVSRVLDASHRASVSLTPNKLRIGCFK